MAVKKRRRLTKFGKVFVLSTLFLVVFSLIGLVRHTSRNFYEKEETDHYLVEIKYPNFENKQLLAYTDEYIENQKAEFFNAIDNLDSTETFQYQFKTDYEINDINNITSVHLNVLEFTGGANYTINTKSYYFDNDENKLVTIEDFLKDDKSLDKLSNISFYYVMKYSDDNQLGFDKEWVKEGLSTDPNNFEHFNFLETGLEIVFPYYQVAPHSAGEVKIIIPYNELNGIIKDEYLKYNQNDNNEHSLNRNLKEFSNKKLIAFTFDDGPSSIATNKL